MHIQSAMLEHGVRETIGFAFDGTGLGDDGAVWGSEGFVTKEGILQRVFHLDYFKLTGGTKAIRQPKLLWLSLLRQIDESAARRMEEQEPNLAISVRAMDKMDWPQTSSMGRVFDMVGIALACGMEARYEAMLPMRLESVIDESEQGFYDLKLRNEDLWLASPLELLAAIFADFSKGTPRSIVSARFHNTLCRLVTDVASVLREETGITRVTLAGGVFQNRHLLFKTKELLSDSGFQVFHPCLVPINDGGIAFGQIHSAGKSTARSRLMGGL